MLTLCSKYRKTLAYITELPFFHLKNKKQPHLTDWNRLLSSFFSFWAKYSLGLLGNNSFSPQTTCRSRGQRDEWSKHEKRQQVLEKVRATRG